MCSLTNDHDDWVRARVCLSVCVCVRVCVWGVAKPRDSKKNNSFSHIFIFFLSDFRVWPFVVAVRSKKYFVLNFVSFWSNTKMRFFKLFAVIVCILFALACLPAHVDCAKKASAPAAATPSPSASSTDHEPVIEEVTQKQLERILQEKDYVAVYWCKCRRLRRSILEYEKKKFEAKDGTNTFSIKCKMFQKYLKRQNEKKEKFCEQKWRIKM